MIFSKNAEVLALMLDLLGENVHKLSGPTTVFHGGRFLPYPLESDLAALEPRDRDYCLNAFLDNPYAEYCPQNMLQFFLVTFGEGLTDLYLRPYNEKLWKFDPALMDMEIVQRMPKPTADEMLRSAQETAKGGAGAAGLHYPRRGGIESLIHAFCDRLGEKSCIRTQAAVAGVERSGSRRRVSTADGAVRQYDRLVSTIPLPQLVRALGPSVPGEVARAASRLKCNSIAVCAPAGAATRWARTWWSTCPTRRSSSSPDEARSPFPGAGGETSSLLAEITYREGDWVDRSADEAVLDRVVADCRRLGLLAADDVLARAGPLPARLRDLRPGASAQRGLHPRVLRKPAGLGGWAGSASLSRGTWMLRSAAPWTRPGN